MSLAADDNDQQLGNPRLLRRDDGRLHLFWRILLGWLAFVAGLGLAVAAATVGGSYGLSTLGQQILLAVVTTSVSVPLIYLLRRYADRRPWRGIGLSSPPSGLPYFLLGIGFIVLIMAVSLLLGSALGWLRIVDVHLPVPTLLVILINSMIAFFYEAFPEEITFRGYLYRNLNTRFPRWLALLLQIVLFVMAPIAITAWMVAIGIGTWDLITTEYIISLIVFSAALQLSRLVTNHLWMSIGFHLAWLEMVRYVIVPSSSAIVEVEYLSPLGSYLISIGSVIIGVIFLLIWSIRKGIDWNAIDPDSDPLQEPDQTSPLPVEASNGCNEQTS